jgi:hypothetical protein
LTIAAPRFSPDARAVDDDEDEEEEEEEVLW